MGMKVNTLNDRRLGEVRLINVCCFVVVGRGGTCFLTPAAIFNVANAVVTLICSGRHVARYACPDHSPQPTQPAPST